MLGWQLGCTLTKWPSPKQEHCRKPGSHSCFRKVQVSKTSCISVSSARSQTFVLIHKSHWSCLLFPNMAQAFPYLALFHKVSSFYNTHSHLHKGKPYTFPKIQLRFHIFHITFPDPSAIILLYFEQIIALSLHFSHVPCFFCFILSYLFTSPILSH